MGREARRVPADWEHPRDDHGQYLPLYDKSFREAAAEWKADFLRWEAGDRPAYCTGKSRDLEYWEWNTGPPDRDRYRPDWPEENRTHYQMYETTTEGTPISPVMPTPELLAQWLVAHRASAFAGMTASYEDWLLICKGRSAVSGVILPTGEIVSGVSAGF